MQRIIVKNFGPLKDIDLEIKDYMIFLGPQASGKSTLAKLIYEFKKIILTSSFNSELWEAPIGENKFSIKLVIDEWKFFLKRSFFPAVQNQKFYFIKFLYHDNVSITLTETNGIINVELSDFFIEKLKIIEKELKNELKKEYILKVSNYGGDYLKHPIIGIVQPKMLSSFLTGGVLFIPDKREINQSAQSSAYYNTLNQYRSYFNEGFISVDKYLQNNLKSYNIQQYNIIKLYFNRILKGNYENIDGGRISLPDGTKIPIDIASSGQQEVIGILIILTIEILKKSRDFYVIEEPEAHLFPEAQKDITYLISLLANQEGNQVIITTHSHYILGALNILINAHRIGQTNPEEVEKIVPKELWVDKNRIFAGFLENGIIKDIYDDEAEMIKIQQLNAVAGEINKDFDRLLDLEFTNENV